MRAKKIDLDLINEHFELVAGELWKINSRTKKPLIGEKTFIMSEDGTKDIYKVNRLIYAMTNNIEEFDYLGSNDDGDLVPLPVDVISLLANIDRDKIWLCKDGSRGYTARLTDLDGVRLSKTFNSYDESIEWQRERTEQIWGDRLRKYNVHKRYFDAVAINRQDNGTMPIHKSRATTSRVYWNNQDELEMLKDLYGDEMPIDDIVIAINDAFGNNRKYGSIQSKIQKLSKAGLL